jgi:hypothetical protein
MSGRLQEKLTDAVRGLVDEIMFRFPVSVSEAQRLLADALDANGLQQLVISIVDNKLVSEVK